MPINVYDTHYMLGAVSELPIEHTFFRNRYFPTNEASDIFGTTRVLADYKTSGQKSAPFVLPRIGSIPGTRDGFSTYDLEPANISISMPLTLDQLQKRGFGESLMSEKTPEQRQRGLMVQDLAELSARISRTEELLAVQTILDNGAIMQHRADREDVYENVGVHFYDGGSNPALFTPANNWTHSTYSSGTWTPGNWYADICSMLKFLASHGRPVTELVVAGDVADFLMDDGWVLAMLDNRRAEMGRIDPSTLTVDAYQLGSFNFKGRILPIIANVGSYEDAAGQDTPFLPNGTVIAISEGCGKGLYGAVTQIENDEEFHTYKGMRIPQTIVTKRPPSREVQLTSRPLFVPKRANPWCVAKSVFGAG